ncbi:hypothetical protein [Stenotrophomonas sp. P5_B8]
MAYISTTDRSHAVVEARPRNESIVIKIGDALIVLEQAEALQLSADLASVAGQFSPALQRGNADLVQVHA